MVSSKAVPEDVNTKFRLKFYHGFTNLKVLYGFKEKEPTRQAIFLSKCST